MIQIQHFKEMNLTHHRITVTEFIDGTITVSLDPRNENKFDTTSIMHNVDDRIIKVASLRKIVVL